jgi:hypothetical protein
MTPYELPTEFGNSWDSFSAEWAAGSGLAYSQCEIARGLATLKRLWPDRIEKLLGGHGRGPAILVPFIDDGILLARCERLPRFGMVLGRLKQGERSAYAELVLASSLIQLGYSPSLEAPLNGKVLDASCELSGQLTYFEVIAPDRSDHSLDQGKLAEELSDRIRKGVTKCRVEVAVLDELDSERVETIVTTAVAALPGSWIHVGEIARVRKTFAGQSLLPCFDNEGATLTIAGETKTQGESTSVIVRWEMEDTRAKRIFVDRGEKGGHFCAIGGGRGELPADPNLQPAASLTFQGPDGPRAGCRILACVEAMSASPPAPGDRCSGRCSIGVMGRCNRRPARNDRMLRGAWAAGPDVRRAIPSHRWRVGQ